VRSNYGVGVGVVEVSEKLRISGALVSHLSRSHSVDVVTVDAYVKQFAIFLVIALS
jgi:hypothetical protein